MASKALDLVTMGHALDTLEGAFFRECDWLGTTTDQRRFLEWWLERRYDISLLSGLEALASTDAGVLNDFLVERGFEPRFEALAAEEIGAVSILDMLVEWLYPAIQTAVRSVTLDRGWVNFPAFQVPDNGAMIYRVEGYDSPLVELLSKSGDSLWLMMLLDEPGDGLELALTAHRLLGLPREPDTVWSGVVVPKVELQTEPDLSWMLGVEARLPEDYFEIVQAFQQFRFRMNEQGARAKVATGFRMMRGMSFTPQPLRIDQPFIGFLTREGVPLPIAVFWADHDCWAEPEGALGEL